MKWYALRRKDGEVLQVASNRESLDELRRIIRNYDGCEIVEVDIIPRVDISEVANAD